MHSEDDKRIGEDIRAAIMRDISRRQVIQRGAALGLSGTMLGGFLAACGGDDKAASPASTAAAANGYDPMKYKGTTINILMTGDENDHRALGDMVSQLEQDTGIKLEITSPALGPLIEKTLKTLKGDRSPYDLINYLGFLTTQQVGAGYYEQLNKYIEDPKETAPDWAVDDFLPAAMNNVARFDIEAGKLGEGDDIYGIPGLHSGSVIYFYRKDLFDEAGLQPAKTWDEFAAAAKALHSDEVAGCSFIGANDFSLAAVDWYTRFLTNGGELMTGSPAEKNFKPQVNSEPGVKALQMLIDLLPYAPENVTSYGFAENVDGFSAGKIAQMIFWSTIAGPVIDPNKSRVADTTGTATVPAAPGETPRAIMGGWGVGIPKNSDPAKKAAAWRALTWMTSKEFNKYEVDKYQIDPSRTSTYQDEELLGKFPYLTDALKAQETADIIPTSTIDEFFQMNDVMNVEFNKALIGGQSAEQACDVVQSEWEQMLRKAGHLA